MKCYCVARNQPIRREITKLQKAKVISLWFYGSVAKCRGSWVVGGGHGSWVWVVGVGVGKCPG